MCVLYTFTQLLLIQNIGFFVNLCDVALILARHFPSLDSFDVASALLSHPDEADRIQATPVFLAGVALSLSGALLRLWCYRSLGRLFTFDLSVRKDHELITTGPYAIVRHPSYLGSAMISVGNLLIMFGPGSWWIESNVTATILGKVFSTAYVAMWMGVTTMLFARIDREDAVLRKEFGASWEAWAQRTPYKAIPFIY